MNLQENVFKQEAVVVALKRLFSNNWFDVSSLNKIASLAEIIIPSDKQKVFDTLHCVHYNTMTKEFREDLAEMIQELFKDFFEVEAHQVNFSEILKEIEFVKQ